MTQGVPYATREDVKAIVSEAVDELAAMIAKTMANKEDVRVLRSETKQDIADLRAEMATKQDIADLRAEMATKTDFRRLESKIGEIMEDQQSMHFRIRHLESRIQ